MSREIKFRAWDKEADVPFMSDVNMMGYQLGNYLSQDRYVVMQYTGLKDKNSKEIYEGDIVKYVTNYYGNRKENQTVVEWIDDLEHDGFGEPLAMGYMFRGGELEVIGNIYENSDLLAPKHNQASQLAEGV